MRHVHVQYRVAPERAAENEALVRAVYEELDRVRPPGLRYRTGVLADGVTFVHQAEVDGPDGRTPLLDLPAFQAFLAGIGERCVDGPHQSALRLVGAYDGGSDSTQSTNSGTSPQFSMATEPSTASVSSGRSQAAS